MKKRRNKGRGRTRKNHRGGASRGRQNYQHTHKGEPLPARLEVFQPDAAGIDVGAEVHYVSVPEDRDPQPVQCFGCYTVDLKRLVQWLQTCRIKSVVMESTGVYWIILYRMLEEAGFAVHLVDPRHVKYVPGRKTDVLDCQWLRQLHTHGLLQGAFVPPVDVAALRTYWRLRKELVESCSREILHMQKALTQMNLHLHVALSDIVGVSGLCMLRAIVAGERNAQVLARMAHPSVKSTQEELVEALTGHYADEHVFALTQALEAFDFLVGQVRACDAQLESRLAQFASKPGAPAVSPSSKRSKRKRRKNEPHFDMRAELARITGVDLTRLDGVDAMTAFTIMSEIGFDVSAFPSAKHFASWLGLCPNNIVTGGRVRRRKTKPIKNRAADALRMAAQSLYRSDSYLGAYFRHMRSRLGAPKAITATAHKLARLIYSLLKHGHEYVDKGQAHLEEQHRERTRRNLVRRAKSLGLDVLDPQTGEILQVA